MFTLEAGTTGELVQILKRYEQNSLFRGQITDYGSQTASGMKTSFDRHGCSPPVMLKWSHYAEFVLRQLLPNPNIIVGIELVQAVLQHYGWRSFFLDASSDPAVSAWFAGHAWSGKRSLQMVEDCFETGVFLRRHLAQYAATEGVGFLYVLSLPTLKDKEVATYDLSVLHVSDARPDVQKAWLVGPLNGELPHNCVAARIAAPRSVMRDFSAQHGYRVTDDLFPDESHDPILSLFLSLPWIKLILSDDVEHPGDLEFYARMIEFPEYQHIPLPKHLPPRYALYRYEHLRSHVFDTDVVFESAPSVAIFGRYFEAEPIFPRVTDLVRQNGRVAFEVDELIWIPETISRGEWGKGLFVEKRDDDLITIGDLIVSHPGRTLSGFGANAGWSYSANAAGRWTRVPNQNECSCGHEWRHLHHLSSLAIIEHTLATRP